jgi:hypothetical protein
MLRPIKSALTESRALCRALGADRELAFTTRAPIIESLFGTDPVGEVTIQVPADAVDP